MAHHLKRAAAAPPAAAGEEVRRTVAELLADVERRGDEAVRDWSLRLDGWAPDSFLVGADEVAAAAAELPEDLCRHIAFAQARVRDFAERQLETLSDLQVETLRGVRLGHRHVPIGAVGAYVPGGRYPMLASAFMTVVVPKVAGVGRVVASAPPRDGGGIHPAVLHAMASSGADRILCLGGVQALAAMAFGLAELEPVDMIVGAGNAYVAEAKRQLFGRVGIDLLAGPTEILVIADATADAGLVAADLLGQAEHGPTSPAVLVTTSAELGAGVAAEVSALLAWLPTREVAGAAWRDHGEIVVARIGRRRSSSPTATPTSTWRTTPATTSSTPTSTACATTGRSSSASTRPWRSATRRSAPITCCPRRARRATPAGSGSANSSRRSPTSG